MPRTDFKTKTMNDVFDAMFGGSASSNIREVRKSFHEHFKSEGDVEDVPVIQTSLTFDSFFHPNKFVKNGPFLMTGQRDTVVLRKKTDFLWIAFIDGKELSTSIIIDVDWKKFVKNEDMCKTFIHKFRMCEFRREFEFEALCDKCNNTKKLIQNTVEHSVWNGIPINIYQQQEIPCTCTNNS